MFLQNYVTSHGTTTVKLNFIWGENKTISLE